MVYISISLRMRAMWPRKGKTTYSHVHRRHPSNRKLQHEGQEKHMGCEQAGHPAEGTKGMAGWEGVEKRTRETPLLAVEDPTSERVKVALKHWAWKEKLAKTTNHHHFQPPSSSSSSPSATRTIRGNSCKLQGIGSRALCSHRYLGHKHQSLTALYTKE